jgi:hypothetical protein
MWRVRWIIRFVEAGRREPLEMVTRTGGLGAVKREP